MGKGDVLVVRRGNIQTITVVFVVLIAILGSTKINIRKDLVSHVRLVSTKIAMAEIIVLHVRLVVALTGFRGELLPVTLVMLVSLRQGVERQHVQDVQRVK